MINAYKEGKDLYSVIASMSFDKPYEDCLEFYPEGTRIELDGKEKICGKKEIQNKAGKERRTQAKAILLGILYGRGAASIGEQIEKSKEEAQEIIDKFFNAFPKVKKWIDETIANAHKLGYVEDIAGRRRRLPDILLPKYNVQAKTNTLEINPLLDCKNLIKSDSAKLVEKYREEVKKCKNRSDFDALKIKAEKENIIMTNNTGFIAQAERQAVNSRVQGGAATLTKLAMLTIFNDRRLRDIGARLINTVHDEILIEVPEINSKLAEDYLTSDMVESAKTLVTNVPMSCDAYNVPCWYLDEFFASVQKEFKELLESGLSDLQSFEIICNDRTESTRDQLYEIVKDYMQSIPDNINTKYKSL